MKVKITKTENGKQPLYLIGSNLMYGEVYIVVDSDTPDGCESGDCVMRIGDMIHNFRDNSYLAAVSRYNVLYRRLFEGEVVNIQFTGE